MRVYHLRFDHLVVKVVPFTGPFADTGKDRETAVSHGDVVDQFHDQNRLADASAAEQADLTALGVGGQQVNNLNAGLQNFRFRGLVGKGRGVTMDGEQGIGLDGADVVLRVAHHIHDASQGLVANRDFDGGAGIDHFLATNQTVGTLHGDGAYRALSKMLRHFQHHILAAALILEMQGVENGWQFAGEANIDHRADDLKHPSYIIAHGKDSAFVNLDSEINPSGTRPRR